MTAPGVPEAQTIDWFGGALEFVLDGVDPAWEGHALCRAMNCVGKYEPTLPPNDLANHGLFVAGILNDMAPDSPLGVFRVLSDQGHGSLTGIARGIEAAIEWAAGKNLKLVLNLSLGIGPPPLLVNTVLDDFDRIYHEDDHWGDLVVATRQALPVDRKLGPDQTSSALQLRALRDEFVIGADGQFQGPLAVLDFLFNFEALPDVLAVAATGNESCAGHPPFGPRIPAAVRGVLGVSSFMPRRSGWWQWLQRVMGALGGRRFGRSPWRRTAYSNDDDLLPNNDGIGAFGGDVDGRGYSAGDPARAPVSLYRPGGAAGGPVGCAYWSGTSFATPVAAGFAAALWSEALDRPSTANPEDPARPSIRGMIVGTDERRDKEYLDFRQR